MRVKFILKVSLVCSSRGSSGTSGVCFADWQTVEFIEKVDTSSKFCLMRRSREKFIPMNRVQVMSWMVWVSLGFILMIE